MSIASMTGYIPWHTGHIMRHHNQDTQRRNLRAGDFQFCSKYVGQTLIAIFQNLSAARTSLWLPAVSESSCATPTCVRCLIWDPLEMTFQPTRQPILILFVTHHSFCPFSWHWHGWVCDFPTLSMRPFERSYALELVWRSGRQAMDGWMGKNLFHSAALSCWALSFHLSVWCRSRMPTLSSACDCFGMCALTYGCLHSKNDEQWASTIRFVVQGVAFFSPFQRSKGEVPVQCRSRSSISRFHFPYWSFTFLFSKSTLLCLP